MARLSCFKTTKVFDDLEFLEEYHNGYTSLNADVSLIEALLQCAKGEEWLLLQHNYKKVQTPL
jgi:hypothetical protein